MSSRSIPHRVDRRQCLDLRARGQERSGRPHPVRVVANVIGSAPSERGCGPREGPIAGAGPFAPAGRHLPRDPQERVPNSRVNMCLACRRDGVLGCARRRAGTERDGHPPAGEAEPGRVLARVRLLPVCLERRPSAGRLHGERDERRAHVPGRWRGDLRRTSEDGHQSCRVDAGTRGDDRPRAAGGDHAHGSGRGRGGGARPRYARPAGRTRIGLRTPPGSCSPR